MKQVAESVPDVEIWPENWDVVNLFLRLSTQWVVTQGAVAGLNYQSVNFILELYDVSAKREIFEDLQVMEFHALKLMNDREG